MPGCPICENRIDDTAWTQAHLSDFNKQIYHLYHCNKCRLEFWTPLKIIPEFYESEGFSAYSGYHQGSRPLPKWSLPFFSHIPLKEGKLLDIGCGDGSFLQRAKSLGFDVYGIDFDKNSIRVANEKYGLKNVITSSLSDFVCSIQKSGLCFDVITFFEVLEHQDNPTEFLNEVMKILAPDGYIAGSVPNRERFLARLDRRFGAGDLPPHHFLWFSKNVLDTFFTNGGFKSILQSYSGNISYRELSEKLTDLVLIRTFKTIQGTALKRIIRLMLSPLAILLWGGYRLRPSHIYFQARSISN